MAGSRNEIYAVGVVACAALAVAVAGFVRDRRDRTPAAAVAGASTCVDPEARAAVEQLRREVARNAAIAGRRQPPAPPGSPPEAPAGGTPPAGVPAPSTAGADAGATRRYVRIEVPNPALTVVQREDGTYDIRTTDPALAGTVIVATATTRDGDVEQLMVRVPP